MHIALLHTADVHVATFNEIFANLGGDIKLTHKVSPNLLDRARRDGLKSVAAETRVLLTELASADAVICTCSTLGPIADEVSKRLAHVLRIDRPVMEAACDDGAHILVAICLQSTKDATIALLEACAAQRGQVIFPRVVLCETAWPYFEAGDMAGYATQIADAVCADADAYPQTDCIVLAQASMRVAEQALAPCKIPVRSSPLPAALKGIALAKTRQK